MTDDAAFAHAPELLGWGEPMAEPACGHGDWGKTFPNPLVREFMRAVGVETCPACKQVVRIYRRRGVIERER